MATHSSIFAWRLPWTEEPGGLQSMGLQRVEYDGAHTQAAFQRSQPPTFCPNARGLTVATAQSLALARACLFLSPFFPPAGRSGSAIKGCVLSYSSPPPLSQACPLQSPEIPLLAELSISQERDPEEVNWFLKYFPNEMSEVM